MLSTFPSFLRAKWITFQRLKYVYCHHANNKGVLLSRWEAGLLRMVSIRRWCFVFLSAFVGWIPCSYVRRCFCWRVLKWRVLSFATSLVLFPEFGGGVFGERPEFVLLECLVLSGCGEEAVTDLSLCPLLPFSQLSFNRLNKRTPLSFNETELKPAVTSIFDPATLGHPFTWNCPVDYSNYSLIICPHTPMRPRIATALPGNPAVLSFFGGVTFIKVS